MMEISFYLNDTHYHGTAVPFEKPGSTDTQYVIRFDNIEMQVFHVYKPADCDWKSDDQSSEVLVSAVGSEIVQGNLNNGPVSSPSEMIQNGEIISEPDDVDEQGINS